MIAVGVLAWAGSSGGLRAAEAVAADDLSYAAGPAAPNLETLRNYECPDWFRDAKFGIRTQWGPQSVPEQGDGYARNFAIPGRRAYDYHVAHFGPPAQVGYDAVLARWTADKFAPDVLVKRFADAGARYVVTLAADRDDFDLWNSSHRRLNAVNFGPKRDIVGAWATAVRTQGLRFGVSEHLAAEPALAASKPTVAERKLWYDRMHELVDQHRPDLLYVAGRVPSAETSWRLMAHLYNRSIEWHEDLAAVFLARTTTDAHIAETGIATIERGSQAAIAEFPWQCDTALSDWVYDRDAPLRPATGVIHELADVVSKNGNLLLNVPLRGDGSLPDAAGAVLDEIGTWLAVNGEAIFGTRPWSVFGEGPTETIAGPLGENKTLPYTPEDVRYTIKHWKNADGEPRETLYAIVLGWPGPREEVVLGELASGPSARPIGTVRLLGQEDALRMVRDADGLHILLPAVAPCAHAIVFRVD